jgi:myo-inositol-1(or 4)-monophosphatase
MSTVMSALSADWLGLCRGAVAGIEAMLIEHPTTHERAVEMGRGEGGDQSLVIDTAAEEVIFALLDELHADGVRFSAISEERGEVDYGDSAVRVVIDPIDGSLNAKRGLTHHGVSIAVAAGETMADVEFAFVHDFGAREEWIARRGAGAWMNRHAVDATRDERRWRDGKLELVAIESADPRWIAASAPDLVDVAHRVRALGSIAIGLCQVACARVDGFVTLWRCRAVDAAAAQLIVRESGGLVSFMGFEDPLGAPLDLIPHAPVIAARTAGALEELARVPAR